MAFNCNYCESTLSSSGSLKIHQKTAKKCIALQGDVKVPTEFICEICDKNFTTNYNLSTHTIKCKNKNIHKSTIEKLNLRISDLEIKLEEKSNKVIELETKCNMLLLDKSDWKQSMDKITNYALSKYSISSTSNNDITIFTRTDAEIKSI